MQKEQKEEVLEKLDGLKTFEIWTREIIESEVYYVVKAKTEEEAIDIVESNGDEYVKQDDVKNFDREFRSVKEKNE